ncbi:hypothetical protein ACK3SF_00060 [Candidatus Nanosalina sp. VS9-1]|uniref:hypothetical protein n=1 Tax=Candidatus Nanosalina sp. VS9-1 TaxID=3388566 RepID=UPI0039DFACEA
MVNIPFLGSSDKDKENDFSNIAGKANLDRSQPGDGDRDIAEMHKSRSKKAFEQDEKFSGSSSEWRKATEVEKGNEFGSQESQDAGGTQRGLSEDDLGLDSGESGENPEEGENISDNSFSGQTDTESRQTPDFGDAKAKKGRLIETGEASNDNDVERSGDELSDSLEENIRSIKGEIDEVEQERDTEEESEDEELEDESLDEAVERFEEIADKLDFDAEDLGLDMDEEDFEEFKEDIQDDIEDLDGRLSEIESSQLDLAEEADNRLEEVEQKVEDLESRIETDSSEEGIKVEGIDTAERLEELESEISEIKSQISSSEDEEASISASEEIHRKALDNEVKELRKDVKELSEAVVTISQKVYQE